MPDAVVVTDANGCVRHMNPAARRMFDDSPKDDRSEATPAADLVRFVLERSEKLAPPATGDERSPVRAVALSSEGAALSVHSTVLTIDREDGGLWGYVLFCRTDAGDRPAMDAIRAAMGMAGPRGAERNQAVEVVSHEISTPLTAICGYADLLLNEKGLSSECTGFVREIKDSATRLALVSQALIAYAHLQTSRARAEPRNYEIRAELAELAEHAGRQLVARGVSWQFVVSPDVPSHVKLDGGRLEDILSQLLDNAQKFTQSGAVSMVVERSLTTKGAVMFRVEDTGIGYLPALSDRIFEPFRQADEGKGRTFGGLGLGLSLARAIAEDMGGSLEARSEAGRGSSFVLTIPVEPAA